jgi:hypothetical protein
VTTGKSLALLRASRAYKEGRFAIVTKRWAQDAVDAAAHQTNAFAADGEVVWFWHLDADAKLRSNDLRNDGDKKARSPGSNCVG